MIQTVAVVGVGLIGGSFALALRKAGFTGRIVGVSSAESIRHAVARGAISAGMSLAEAAPAADLIYLSLPIDQILATLPVLAPVLNENCLVTDAGSTKAEIVSQATSTGLASRFLGGHPLAGKEQRGILAADADLFQGRPYVLTPTAAPSPITDELTHWLTRIGAVVVEMDPAEHDVTVAATSHLPQLLATALALNLSRNGNPFTGKIFGPGLLDMTRLALSAPEVWLSVLRTNKGPVKEMLQSLRFYLAELESALDKNSELEKYFEEAAAFARLIRG